jgi:hypothetical protein
LTDQRRLAIAGLIGVVVSVVSLFPIAGGAYFLWPAALLLQDLSPGFHGGAVLMIPLIFAVDWGSGLCRYGFFSWP